MPVPSTIADISTTASLNSPAGSDNLSTTDDYLRSIQAIVKTQDNLNARLATANSFTSTQSVTVNTTTDAFKITQTGTGNAFVVEDSASTDATPFVIDANGNVGIGASTLTSKLQVEGTGATTAPTVGGSKAASIYAIDTGSAAGSGGGIEFGGVTNKTFAAIKGGLTDGTSNTLGYLGFYTRQAITDAAMTERMRIDSNGNVGIGAASQAGYKLLTAGLLTGAVTSVGNRVQMEIQSDVTANAIMFSSAPSTQATAFTLGSLAHFRADQSTFGASSVVTNQNGFFAAANIIGATNNFGFYGGIAAGAGRYNLYMGGTADNYLAGKLGIGAVAGVQTNVNLEYNISGATTSNGLIQTGTIQSNVTALGRGFVSVLGTQATTFTLSQLYHYASYQGTFGAGSTVTNQMGFFTESSLIGATNNLGFYGNIPAGTGRYNLYMNGTADNYLAGKLGIGATVLTGYNLRVASNLTGATNVFGIQSQGAVQSDVTVAAHMFRSVTSTQATTFTLPALIHYSADQQTFGAGSTVTNQYGYTANSTLIGATSNFGFYGDIAAGTSRWNFYAAGTANNAYAGNSSFGKFTAPISAVDTTSFASSIVTNTVATYTVLATDSTIIQTTAASTYTLPAASSFTGRILHIVTQFAGTVISASSNVVPLVGGAAGTAILAATAGKYAKLQSNGTNWIIIEAN